MTASAELIQRAFAAYRRGELDAAQTALNALHDQAPRDVNAAHLQALVSRKYGDAAGSEGWFRHALRLSPGDGDILNNYANLLSSSGRFWEAAARWADAFKAQPAKIEYKIAQIGALLSADLPHLAQSAADELLSAGGEIPARGWTIAGRAHQAAQAPERAAECYREALRLAPEDQAAASGLIDVLGGLGRIEEAETCFAERGRDVQAEAAIARARLFNARQDAALADFRRLYDQSGDPRRLRDLAQGLWVAGREEAFDALIAAVADTGKPGLVAMAADCLAQIDREADALTLLDRLPANAFEAGGLLSLRAKLRQAIGDVDGALADSRIAYEADPNDQGVATGFAVAALMAGDLDAAERVIAVNRERLPLNQGWVAYQITLWRLQGDARADALEDYDRFVVPYELPAAGGFKSGAALNEALREVLAERHFMAAEPFNQSLRAGRQTPRSLLSDPSPVVQAYLEALRTPIAAYIEAMGRDPDHLLTSRNTGAFKLSGCWSVQLFGGGRHVNHFHPAGWISSAYYVDVPEKTLKSDRLGGCIKFGEPSFTTRPKQLEAGKIVRPQPGMLVLFPSYMWHGTVPIEPGETRMTAPFDVVPA
ncbi:MAG: putative 2OG-Fe(II) oxygenase [Oceanicaulis sp.]